MPFFDLRELPSREVLPGVSLQAAWLDHVMTTFFVMEAGALIPEHRHPHEQISYVIEGEMEFTLDGETRVLRAGQGVCVPSGAAHSARMLRRVVALDAWSPPRDDYKA